MSCSWQRRARSESADKDQKAEWERKGVSLVAATQRPGLWDAWAHDALGSFARKDKVGPHLEWFESAYHEFYFYSEFYLMSHAPWW